MPIVYGLPTDRAMAAAGRGEVRLGGCAIPTWPVCRRCGNLLTDESRRASPVPGLTDLRSALDGILGRDR